MHCSLTPCTDLTQCAYGTVTIRAPVPRRSQLYSANSETKFVDESLRRSRFRAIVDEQLFCLCDEIVEAVNQQAGEHAHFSLVRSDATQIEYTKGGALGSCEPLTLTSNPNLQP